MIQPRSVKENYELIQGPSRIDVNNKNRRFTNRKGKVGIFSFGLESTCVRLARLQCNAIVATAKVLDATVLV